MLGYVGLDNTGMTGIEYALREGDPRARGQGRGPHRRPPPAGRARPSGPRPTAHTVVLALDEAIQHVAERELERAMAETQAAAGMVVVVEPFSGEVLAMAGRPTFNPNRYAAYPSSRWRNRAVSDAFEPGSIFKIVTAAAGDPGERGRRPDEVLDCGNGQDRDLRAPSSTTTPSSTG